MAHRYRCLKCKRTFRVYSQGVSVSQQSDALKALSVLLYVLGLSYQGVVALLTALGHPLSLGTVFDNVQSSGLSVQRLRRAWVMCQAGQIMVMGIACTRVKCLT